MTMKSTLRMKPRRTSLVHCPSSPYTALICSGAGGAAHAADVSDAPGSSHRSVLSIVGAGACRPRSLLFSGTAMTTHASRTPAEVPHRRLADLMQALLAEAGMPCCSKLMC